AANLHPGCRDQLATVADEYREVLNAAVGPVLAFDRVKYCNVGKPIVVEVSRRYPTGLLVFLAPYRACLSQNVSVYDFCVRIIDGKGWEAVRNENDQNGEPTRAFHMGIATAAPTTFSTAGPDAANWTRTVSHT